MNFLHLDMKIEKSNKAHVVFFEKTNGVVVLVRRSSGSRGPVPCDRFVPTFIWERWVVREHGEREMARKWRNGIEFEWAQKFDWRSTGRRTLEENR